MSVGLLRAVVVDDHPLLSLGLRAELERMGVQADLADLAEDGDRRELLEWIIGRSADCVVIDLGLPLEGGGLALIPPLVEGDQRVAVLTGEDDVGLWATCAAAGAEVVLSKSDPMIDIVDTIRRVCRGETVKPQQRLFLRVEGRRLADERRDRLAALDTLTGREREVLAALMDGLGAADLAARDIVSIQTVRTQIKNVLRKLGARSQLEAVARAHSAGWSLERSTIPGA